MKITILGFNIFSCRILRARFYLHYANHFHAFIRIYNGEGRQLTSHLCRIVIEVSKFLHICRILGI